MKHNLYLIKDNKVGFLNAPFMAANNSAAIRGFKDICMDASTIISKHPEDYELYAAGSMDEDTGEITSKVTFLERATTFVDL